MISGLDDVVVAETKVSDVDGQAGRLVIRGRSLDDLVRDSTYEDVLALLWEGFFEPAPPAADLAKRLAAARQTVFGHLQSIDTTLLKNPLFDVVRVLIARVVDGDDLDNALLLVAAPAVFTPGIIRMRQGLEPIPPDEIGRAHV